jgi:hypothetical protein
MRSILAVLILCAMLAPVSLAGGDSAEKTFKAFMATAKDNNLKKAINQYGVDERNDKNVFAARLPGELKYDIKNVSEKSGNNEATIKADIEYTKFTEKTGDKVDNVTDKAGTAGKLATGNVVGAAGGAARNSAQDAVGGIDFHRSEKVKMVRKGGEWKVVVTDEFYNALTGKD